MISLKIILYFDSFCSLVGFCLNKNFIKIDQIYKIINTINQKTLKFGVSMGTFPDKAPTEYLDDIGVWSRALNESEITALYQGTYCPPPQNVRF